MLLNSKIKIYFQQKCRNNKNLEVKQNAGVYIRTHTWWIWWSLILLLILAGLLDLANCINTS